MSLRASAHIAARPWLDAQPVPSGGQSLLDIAATFLAFLDIAEVAVELLPVPSRLLSSLMDTREKLQDTLASDPVLTGPLLRVLDDAGDAMDKLLDWLNREQACGTGHVIVNLDKFYLAREWEP